MNRDEDATHQPTLPDGQWLTENPSVEYPEAWLWCDRNGVLGMGTHVPSGMLPISRAPWLRSTIAATGLALRSPDGAAWIVPDLPEAGESSDAALNAVMAFKQRVDTALYHTPYVITVLIQARVAMERMRSGMAMRAFQAVQQAATMAS